VLLLVALSSPEFAAHLSTLSGTDDLDADLRNIRRSVDRFAQRHGRLPRELRELNLALRDPARVDAAGWPTDPFGNRYRLEVSGVARAGEFRILSIGRDRVDGTGDDRSSSSR